MCSIPLVLIQAAVVEIEDDDNEQALVVEIDDEPIDQAGLH